MGQLEQFKGRNTSWYRLIGVAILISWEAARVRVAKLPACASSPRVEMTLGKDSHSVCFAARNFFDLHLAEGNNQLRLGLIRAAVFVLRHTARVRVTKLAATTASP